MINETFGLMEAFTNWKNKRVYGAEVTACVRATRDDDQAVNGGGMRGEGCHQRLIPTWRIKLEG